MSVMILDTETTGLPMNISYGNFPDPKKTEDYESSRILQIGYIILKKDKIISEKEMLIRPEKEYKIPKGVPEGVIIPYEKAKLGICIDEAFSVFLDDLKKVETIVAHNITFDINIILSECYRRKSEYLWDNIIEQIKSKKQYCTMLHGKAFLKSKKSPRLTELFKVFSKEEWTQKHTALNDANACLVCYRGLTM